MRQDQLTHTLTARIAPSLRDELAAAAEGNDETVGQFVRRAIQNELRDARGRALDPLPDLTLAEKQQHLHEAVAALGDAEATRDLIHAIGDELVDLLDAGFLTLDVLHDDAAHQRLERASGYLRQGSESLQRAASRLKALRTHQLLSSGELDRVETRLRQEG